MEEKKLNLEIYNKVKSVPENAQRPFNNGKFTGTDINPMWRIKVLTELFGPCGFGWYYEVVNREIIPSQDGTLCSFVSINLYVKNDKTWSKPIYGEGGNVFSKIDKYGKITTSDEAYKMALTDAMSNAAKQLGVGADIWWNTEPTKYTGNVRTTETTAKTQTFDEIKKEYSDKLNACNDPDNARELYKTYAPKDQGKVLFDMTSKMAADKGWM